ncbi:HPP family protein [Terrihabitans rhizophilus]|uniref:HPP family protein n=1 Tax=Terrihabitans rhizophilus TaxID=3092662 RepID=A0ABU4RLP4_9HYPH|nr:HPP family protein [Terrihabitans sp. PJ23]MDX6805746.1 HPP family protein [Terrihabitans sp. PJ23]
MQNTGETTTEPKAGWRLFRPILAGATLNDRVFASLAALVSIALTGFLSALLTGVGPHLILLVPPMGASAVLVFAVPASPLAQPWSTIGGNVVSAFVGILVAHLIDQPALAAGVAVGGAIMAMSLLRCLHPPGGAAALVAVFGGPAVAGSGFLFPLVPVGLNAVLLVAGGLLYHQVSRHSYPHRAKPPAPARPTSDPAAAERVGVRIEDVERVIQDLGETFDISNEDLARLLTEVERRALARSYVELSAGDIMSRDVIGVTPDTSLEAARKRLLELDFRILPVVGAGGKLLGQIGWPELSREGERVEQVMSTPVAVAPAAPVLDLADQLTGGTVHAVLVVDADTRLIGLITQTDLLAVLARGVTGTMREAAARS